MRTFMHLSIRRPNSYISDSSTTNYEALNVEEFGDDVGYSEPLERAAVESAGLKYMHMPVGSAGNGYTAATIKRYSGVAANVLWPTNML